MCEVRGGAPSTASTSTSARSAKILTRALTGAQRSACAAARERVRIAPSVSSRRPFT